MTTTHHATLQKTLGLRSVVLFGLAYMTPIIVLGIFGTNSLLQRAYGDASSPMTGNFSYVLCGLSLGTGWEGCPSKQAALPSILSFPWTAKR